MSVIRVNKNTNYTVISNYHLRDKNISLKAKGLLSLMLSLPDDWDYSIAGLVAISKESETSIKSTLDELKENNYLKVTKLLPNETETGRIEYIYDIYEQSIEKQEGEKQGVENLGVEFLGVENIGQLNTNNKITYKPNTNNKKEIYKESKIVAKSIIDYLNLKTGKHFKYTQNNIKKIEARLKEFDKEDFKIVIDKKTKEWLDDDKMNCYLRPETLFGSKFESYLNQKEITTNNPFIDILKEEYYGD